MLVGIALNGVENILSGLGIFLPVVIAEKYSYAQVRISGLFLRGDSFCEFGHC